MNIQPTKTRELKSTTGPEETKDILAMRGNTKERSHRHEITQGFPKFNNSDNMRSIFSDNAEPSGNERLPKGINNVKYDSNIYKESLVNHTQTHRKGNIALQDGKVFYLK